MKNPPKNLTQKSTLAQQRELQNDLGQIFRQAQERKIGADQLADILTKVLDATGYPALARNVARQTSKPDHILDAKRQADLICQTLCKTAKSKKQRDFLDKQADFLQTLLFATALANHQEGMMTPDAILKLSAAAVKIEKAREMHRQQTTESSARMGKSPGLSEQTRNKIEREILGFKR